MLESRVAMSHQITPLFRYIDIVNLKLLKYKAKKYQERNKNNRKFADVKKLTDDDEEN
jgi:hypothetical protein